MWPTGLCWQPVGGPPPAQLVVSGPDFKGAVEQDRSGWESAGVKPTWLDYRKRTVNRFLDGCMINAAGLAYYTTFSLPPLLLIIISVVGLAVGRQAIQHQIELAPGEVHAAQRNTGSGRANR